MFRSAPSAFFLQDWSDFNRKFYYLHHRVLAFCVDLHSDPFPTPHPCVKHAAVLSLPYATLKARFEFALRTGLSATACPAAAAADTNKNKNKKNKQNQKNERQTLARMDFESLFLLPVHEFLVRVAPPTLSEEEYYVFENMMEQFPDEEDDVIEQVVRLQVQGQDMVPNARIQDIMASNDDESDDEESDERTFRRTHRLTECSPSGQRKRKVFRPILASSSATEEKARERASRRLTHPSSD